MTAAWRTRGLAGLALLAACGGGEKPIGPTAGTLTVAYFQGGAPAGALLVTITGGEVQSVGALNGSAVTAASPGAGVTRVLVTGTITTGDLFTIRVPDISKFANYTAQTDQVADHVTFALLNPGSYTLVVRK